MKKRGRKTVISNIITGSKSSLACCEQNETYHLILSQEIFSTSVPCFTKLKRKLKNESNFLVLGFS